MQQSVVARGKAKRHIYGPNIVRAWFDTVINPLLRGLSRERQFLEKRNWTYRVHTGRLEEIDGIYRLLPMDAPENLVQLGEFFPDTLRFVKAHDAQVDQLRTSCRECAKAIRESQLFQRQFSAMAAKAGDDLSSHFGAYSSLDDRESLIAEHIVNNRGPLPDHYATHQLWNEYRERFAKVSKDGAVAKAQGHCKDAGDALLKTIDDFLIFLKTTRSRLSLEKDVPIVVEPAGPPPARCSL